tara:strand:+ start:201 stop:1907 length:1707 start_codon:yes stop_codon:yes gene_type:complete
MAFNNIHTNQQIKNGFPAGRGGKFSRDRWTRIAQMTGNYNQWFLEENFRTPNFAGKQNKIKMIKIKCPQHIVDSINLLYNKDVRWKKFLPGGTSQNANTKFEAYKGAAKPPSEGDLYVDTMWPWTSEWQPSDNTRRDVKERYQIIRFIASGKTEGSAKVSAAAMTKLQETGSAIVFRHVIIGNLKNPKNAMDIANHKPCREELDREWQSVAGVPCDMGWIENFFKQQKALLAALASCSGSNQFEEFQRDGDFMKFITDEWIGSKNPSGIKGKDNWNPADIWLIKNQNQHIRTLRSLMSSPATGSTSFRKRLFASKIDQFNAKMRQLFKDKEIWGVSLKLVTQKEAKWEFVNVDDAYFASLESKQFKLGTGAYKPVCKLSTETKEGAEIFTTQDSILWVVDGDAQYKFQVKANTSTKRDNLKYEATQKGFGAARLGKATAEYVEGLITAYRSRHFNPKYKDFEKSNSEYPYTGDEFLEWKDKITEMATFLDKQGVDLDGVKPEDAYNRIMGAQVNTPHVANSKVMQMAWLCTILSIHKDGDDNINEFLTDLVFMSKKEGKQYGPFLKLY